jgi:hypothetical protein
VDEKWTGRHLTRSFAACCWIECRYQWMLADGRDPLVVHSIA